MNTALEKCYFEPNSKLTGSVEEIKKQKAVHLNKYFETVEEATLVVMTPTQQKLWYDMIGKQYDPRILAELRTYFKISEVDRVFP